MASKKKLKALTEELRKRHIPQGTIWELESLSDNFVYSSLINSAYGEEIQGYSPVELSNWLKKKNLVNDYDVLNLILNNDEEVQDGQ